MLSLMLSFPAEKVLIPGVPTAEDAHMDDYWSKRIRDDIAEQHAEAAVAAELGLPLKKKMKKMEDYSTEEMSTSEEKIKLDENDSDPDKLD